MLSYHVRGTAPGPTDTTVEKKKEEACSQGECILGRRSRLQIKTVWKHKPEENQSNQDKRSPKIGHGTAGLDGYFRGIVWRGLSEEANPKLPSE